MVNSKKYSAGIFLLAFIVCTSSFFTSFTITDEEAEEALKEVRFYKENYSKERDYSYVIVKYIRKDPEYAVLFVDKLGIDPNMVMVLDNLSCNMFVLATARVLEGAIKTGDCKIKIIENLYIRGGNPNKRRRWPFKRRFSAKEIAYGFIRLSNSIFAVDREHVGKAGPCARLIKRMFDKGLGELIKKKEAENAYKEFKKKQEEENNMHSF